MKIVNVAWILALSFLVTAGCSGEKWSDMMTGSRVVAQPQPIQYSGPRVTVIVAQITNRTGSGTEIATTGTTIQTGAAAAPPDKTLTIRDPIGSGMRDQLVTALTHTGVFTVVRTTETGRRTGSVNPMARYLIEGAVTEYEPSQASVAGGYGWGIRNLRRVSDPTVSPGNVFSQVLAPNAIGGMFQQDHIAMNIHLVDLNTNGIISSTTVEATPKDLGAAMNLLFGGGSRIADVGGQMKTPMQKAIRACMAKAAAWAANSVTSQQ